VGDLCLGDARCPSASLGQPRTGGSPGAGRGAMAVEDFGAVGAAGGGGAVGVQGDGPSLLVDGHVVVIKQYSAQPSTLVLPPSARWVTWCTSHAEAGWSQPPS
jgi:hypothetical protein